MAGARAVQNCFLGAWDGKLRFLGGMLPASRGCRGSPWGWAPALCVGVVCTQPPPAKVASCPYLECLGTSIPQ